MITRLGSRCQFFFLVTEARSISGRESFCWVFHFLRWGTPPNSSKCLRTWEGNWFIALHAWRWIFDIRLSPLGNSACSCGRICGIGRYRWCGCVRWEKKPIILSAACSFSAWIQSPLLCFWQGGVEGWFSCRISGRFLAIFACIQPGLFSLLSVLPFRPSLLAKGFGAFDAVFLPVGCNANRDMAADTACIRDVNSNYLGI